MDKATFLGNMDKYLEGTLSNSVKAQFENEINLNSELKKEFELHKQTKELIIKDGRRNFLSKLDHLKNEIDGNNTPKDSNKSNGQKKFLPWTIALASIVLISLLVFYYTNKDTPVVNNVPFAEFSKEVEFYPSKGMLGGTTKLIKNLAIYNSSESYYRYDSTFSIYLTAADLKILKASFKNKNFGAPIKEGIETIIFSDSEIIINDLIHLQELN